MYYKRYQKVHSTEADVYDTAMALNAELVNLTC